ncbi:MAG: hypothetical protein Q8K91_07645 [Hylemonella sp.]|nr:hypothetical protein [Hylemonella sp.]MDP1937063.1 hypothetical protein [Hylemonella sp.]
MSFSSFAIKSRYAAIKIGAAIYFVLFACSAYTAEFPCGIVSLRKEVDGIALRFDKTFFWRFSHSNGDWGVIGLSGIAILERNGVSLQDPIEQPELRIQLNEHVKLIDHHQGCRLLLVLEKEMLTLKASGEFSFPGSKLKSFEATLNP